MSREVCFNLTITGHLLVVSYPAVKASEQVPEAPAVTTAPATAPHLRPHLPNFGACCDGGSSFLTEIQPFSNVRRLKVDTDYCSP